jgi:hypothetical protein
MIRPVTTDAPTCRNPRGLHDGDLHRRARGCVRGDGGAIAVNRVIVPALGSELTAKLSRRDRSPDWQGQG